MASTSKPKAAVEETAPEETETDAAPIEETAPESEPEAPAETPAEETAPEEELADVVFEAPEGVEAIGLATGSFDVVDGRVTVPGAFAREHLRDFEGSGFRALGPDVL